MPPRATCARASSRGGSSGARARARPPRRSTRERRRRSRPQPAARARGAARLEPDAPGARRLARRDAYWRQKSWKRIVVIGAGPVVNLVCALILFAAVFMTVEHAASRHRRGRGERSPGGGGRAQAGRPDRHPRRPPGQGQPRFPTQINATHGRPFRLIVVRKGKRSRSARCARSSTSGRVPDRNRDQGQSTAPASPCPRASREAVARDMVHRRRRGESHRAALRRQGTRRTSRAPSGSFATRRRPIASRLPTTSTCSA